MGASEIKKAALSLASALLLVLVVAGCGAVQKWVPPMASEAAWIAWLALLAGFVWVCWYGTRAFWKALSVRGRLLVAAGAAVVALLSCAGVVCFLHSEDTIRQYDSTVYWTHFINWNNLFFTSIPQAFSELRASLSAEYSLLPAVLPTPLARLGGLFFAPFVLSNTLFYQLPAMLSFAIFAERCIARAQGVPVRAMRTLGLFVLCCVFTGPLLYLLQGYVDVIGLLWIGLLLNATLDHPLDRFSLSQFLYLALVSLLLLLSRRWYAFYIVGFYAAFGVEFVVRCAMQRRFDRRRFGALCAMLVSIAGLCVVCILLLNPDILKLFLGNNYAEAYSAYKTRTIWKDLWVAGKEIGLLVCAAALGGAVWMALHRGARAVVLRLTVAGMVAVVLFSRVQSMGVHHRSLLYPLVLVGMCTGTAAVVRAVRTRKAKCAAAGVCAVLYGCNLAVCFVPATGNLPSAVQAVFAGARQYPASLASKQAILNCTSWLQEQTSGTNKTIYACGEGNLFSHELLRRTQLPVYVDALPNLFSSNIVDLRDGFPSQALLADYVVVLDPFQTGFTDRQEVSWQVWQMVTEQYTLVQEFPVDDSTSICVYERPESGRYARAKALSDGLRAVYPDQSFVWQPDWFSVLADFSLGSPEYRSWTPHLIATGTVVDFTLHTEGEFDRLSLTVSCNQPDTQLTVEADGEVLGEYTIQDSQPLDLALNGAQEVRFVLRPQKTSVMTVFFNDPQLS